jgi:hypothetical protein
MNQKEAQALVQKHGSQMAAAAATGIPRSTFGEIFRGGRDGLTGRGPAAGRLMTPGGVPPSPRVAGVAVTKFLNQFDYEAQLQRVLRKLCGARFVSDADIRATSGITPAVYRRVADLPAFDDWKIKIEGRLWWSTPANVKQVRERQQHWGLR